MLRTTADLHATTVEVTDLVTPAEPVLVRGIRSSSAERLVVHVADLDGDDRSGAGYVDPGSGALVFYLRDVALAVALVAADTTSTMRESNGREPAHDVVVALRSTGSSREASSRRHASWSRSGTPDEAIARLRRPASSLDVLVAERTAARPEAIALARQAEGEDAVGELCTRSLLVLEQLTDRQTGATIAAPEFDPSFEQSGGYGFVWPRDLGYVVLGFLAAGRGDLAVPALRWLAREQAPEGLWLQRYWTDGSLAPSWGLHQLDETGMAVFAYEAAWRELGDAALDRELWPSARAAADFLCGFVDDDTGLPLPSVDLWEQTDGQHSYSAAATYGGLVTAGIDGDAARARARGALPPGRRARARGDRGASLERGARRYCDRAGSGARTSSARSRLPRSTGSSGTRRRCAASIARTRASTARSSARLAVSSGRSVVAPDARHDRGGRARAPARRRRRPPARGRRLRRRQSVAHLDAVARARRATVRRRRRSPRVDRVRARATDLARPASGAGHARRRPPAWVDPARLSHAMLILAARPELALVGG